MSHAEKETRSLAAAVSLTFIRSTEIRFGTSKQICLLAPINCNTW